MKTQIKFTIIITVIFYLIGSGINANFNLTNWILESRQLIGGCLLAVIVLGWIVISAEKNSKDSVIINKITEGK